MSQQLQKALIKLGSKGIDFNTSTPEEVLEFKSKWDTPQGRDAMNFRRGWEATAAKQTFWPEFGRKVGLGIGIAAGVTGVTYIADLIIDKLRENRQQAASAEYFQKMLEAHPTLQKEDPELLAKYWSSLYHFAPNMAQDPLAAGAYIKQSIVRLSHDQFGGPPPETFSTLTQIQKQYRESNKSQDSLNDAARKKAVEQVVALGAVR